MRAFTFATICATATGVSGQVYAQVGGTAAPSEPQDTHTLTTAPSEPQYTLDDHFLRVTQGGSTTSVDLGCMGRSALRSGPKIFVACGRAGVVEIDLSDPLAPRPDGVMPVDGSATSLFLHDGVPWVEIAHVDARAVHVSPVGSQSATPAQTASVYRPAEEHEAAAGERKEAPSIVAPERHGGLWELSLLSGAFITFGSLGAGVLGSASVAYRFEWPLVLRAEVAPFGVAGPSTTTTCCSFPGGPTTSSGGAVGVLAANLLLALDTQFVEVGLGVGGASVNENSPGNGGQPQNGAVQIVESARIGAHDGLALVMESSAIALNNQFNLGYFTASVQIPLSAKAMLIARGGGGNVGFGYGDLGVRVLVRGSGGKGTIGLTGFAGAASIQENLCSVNPDPPNTTACRSATLVGPSLGASIDWRL